ncbi:MAG: threonine ammonia-lyase [Alphaproteobacteria bacterium]|nr:threonine ammonia-lyase [Alphaproteobacteria bacterium]
MTVNIEDIEAAAETIAGDVVHTPTASSPALSQHLGTDLRLKLESLQLTGSFKVRGARNRLGALDRAQTPGVIACSAGNHAQGVAYFAGRMGIPATIVMPRDTPFAKVESTERYGAQVILEGDGLAEAQAHTREIASREGLEFIHPYNDELIIAGQGTAGLEMIADAPDLDAVLIPIGGGGLIGGCAVAIKARKPDVEVIGVEVESYATMRAALGGPASKGTGATLAEGIAVKTPGDLTIPLVREFVDDIIAVDEAAVENAVELTADTGRLVVEGAGATPLAAVMEDPGRFEGRRVGLLVSGGNIDMRVLASVLLRGLVRGGQMVRLRVQISDSPGQLARVSSLIGDAGGNIVEIVHQRMFYDVPVKQTELDVVVETRNGAHAAELVDCLSDAGLPTRMLSDVTGIASA